MSDLNTFCLPDLGEGLPDATIVEWFVREGESVSLDAPLVALETAKAVVDVPSPVSGTVVSLAGQAGDVIATGAPLAIFRLAINQPQRAIETHDEARREDATLPPSPQPNTPPSRPNDQAIVGQMEASHAVAHEPIVAIAGIRALPAARAFAHKHQLDLSVVVPTGPDQIITLDDVKHAFASKSAPSAPAESPSSSAAGRRTPISASGRPMRTRSPTEQITGQPSALRGAQRNMARVMAEAHRQVVPTTLCEDADIASWSPHEDMTVRLIRAIVAASRAEPALNAWFDGEKLTWTLHDHVDVGIAVDTDEGLFVPALRNADMLDKHGLREAINRLRKQIQTRTIPASELSGSTISLSNFGMFAGRYATPIVVPPAVAIIAAGRARDQLTPVMGGIATHRMIPLSLTFDHRAVTGGQAARFLRALLQDLETAV